MQFRTDINGLRAIAVLAVMLYHFGLFGFDGGFTGVDIFFVISGFLMTGIILTGMQRGDFSFRQFYLSRCKRILPALTVLCLVLLFFGWFWMGSVEYKMLGRHAAAAMAFVSNFLFKNESGYFDTFSQDKHLLHTWSLSVEWQFYLVYPLLLALITGWFRRKGAVPADALPHALLWLVVLAAASYALSVYVTPRQSAFAFYLLPTRFWELLAGGIVYLGMLRHPPGAAQVNIVFTLGLGLIATGIAGFDSNTLWPGYAVAVPVLGTACVIWAHAQNAFILNHALMQKIGIWSYSIYLWHWPVMVVLRHLGAEHSLVADVAGVAASVTLGALSYHLVEEPFRTGKLFRQYAPRRRKALVCGIVAAVLALGFTVDLAKGFPVRVSAEVQKIEQEVILSKRARPRNCGKGDERFSHTAYECDVPMPDFIVLGDSHASSGFEAIEKAAGEGKSGWMYSMTCPPFANTYLKVKDHSRQCPAFFQNAFKKIEALPADIPLFIIFRYAMYLHGPNEHPTLDLGVTFTDTDQQDAEPFAAAFERRLTETVCETAKNGRPVYLVGPVPEIGMDVPNTLIRRIIFRSGTTDISISLQDYMARQAPVLTMLDKAAQTCGEHVQVLDILPYLCPEGICKAAENALPLYTDDNHLARLGNAKLLPLYTEVLQRHIGDKNL